MDINRLFVFQYTEWLITDEACGVGVTESHLERLHQRRVTRCSDDDDDGDEGRR